MILNALVSSANELLPRAAARPGSGQSGLARFTLEACLRAVLGQMSGVLCASMWRVP